jgi:hypothetical protein
LTLLKGAEYADYIFRPEVDGISLTDMKHALSAIEIGRQTVEDDWERVKRVFRTKK